MRVIRRGAAGSSPATAAKIAPAHAAEAIPRQWLSSGGTGGAIWRNVLRYISEPARARE
jgi:hypothetical protein